MPNRRTSKEDIMALRVPKAELPAGLRESMIRQLGTVPEPVEVTYRNRYGRRRSYATRFEGIVKNLQRRYLDTDSEWTREKIARPVEQFRTIFAEVVRDELRRHRVNGVVRPLERGQQHPHEGQRDQITRLANLEVGRNQVGVVGATMNSLGNLAAMLNPLIVAYSVEWLGSWNVPLYLMGMLFLVGAACWVIVDPERPVFDESLAAPAVGERHPAKPPK